MENTNIYPLVTRVINEIGRKITTLFFKGSAIVPTLVESEKNLKVGLYHLKMVNTEGITAAKNSSDPDNSRAIYDEIRKQLIRLEILVNAARQGLYKEFSAKDLQSELESVRLNTYSLGALTTAYINEAKIEN